MATRAVVCSALSLALLTACSTPSHDVSSPATTTTAVTMGTGATTTAPAGVVTTAAPPAVLPTTTEALCAQQSWPRPLPQVAGMDFSQVSMGALACLNNLRGLAPDGHDVGNDPANAAGQWIITTMAPPAGTPVGRDDTVTVQLAPTDITATAFHPCDWVTEGEASKIFGWQSLAATPVGDHAGSVSQSCQYNGGGDGHMVTSELMLPGAFAVDPQGELDMLKSIGPGADVAGLSGPAYCAAAHEGNGASTLIVLLSGGRAFRVYGWGSTPSCDQLTQFARTATGRIPA